MARSPERTEPLQPPLGSADAAASLATHSQATGHPTSPARSDKSSDSEGKPVRKQLQGTSLEPSTSDQPRRSDLAMGDVTNGTEATGELSGSGSESGRGRLRRKRSREDFEDEEKPQGKKIQESHVRKKSRDLAIPAIPDEEAIKIETKEQTHDEGDTSMVSIEGSGDVLATSTVRSATPEAGAGENGANAVISPKNKRTLDQTKSGEDLISSAASENSKVTPADSNVDDERDSKRQRDTDEPMVEKKDSSKIPLGSGFANSSTVSPFAVISPKSTEKSISEKSKDELPQTSEAKFKASGFGSFAAASSSPFGAIAKSSSASPFAAAPTSKLSSFASPPAATTSAATGFGALGSSSSKSAFGGTSTSSNGGSVFGGPLGTSAFGGLGSVKPGAKGFATPGAQTITGLKQKSDRPFGQHGEEDSDEEDEGDAGSDESSTEQDAEKAQSKFPPHAEPVETGEEGEEQHWVGRGKLYTLAGEGASRGWQERGTGPFKLNVTAEPPIKARFILRADATHRLLLNAAVTPGLKFGNAEGKKPTDGRLIFSSPTVDGKLEMHTIRMKPDKAAQLWDVVEQIKKLL